MKRSAFGHQSVRMTAACVAALVLAILTPARAGTSTTPAQALDLAAVRDACLAKHNLLRRAHGSPAMTLDASLNATAQAWAEEIAASGTLGHSQPGRRNGAGENVFVSSLDDDAEARALGEAAVDSWYAEIKDHDFNDPALSMQTIHFTQVVWKGSTRLGVGAARGTMRMGGDRVDAYFVVCHYAPAGNTQGRLAENVRPRGSGGGDGGGGTGGGGAATPPRQTPPAGSPGASAPRLASVDFKEASVEGRMVGTLTLVTSQTAGTLAVEINGRTIAPPLEITPKPDKGFVRVKGTRKELNVVKGANSVVYVVDGRRSAAASFTY